MDISEICYISDGSLTHVKLSPLVHQYTEDNELWLPTRLAFLEIVRAFDTAISEKQNYIDNRSNINNNA